MSVRVLIADDHPAVRRGLVRGLRLEADMDLVGEAGDGSDAVRLAKELNPDVVIMDVEMPCLNGIEATRRISLDCPRTKIVGLSSHAPGACVHGMLKAGASAYVLKDDDFEELVKAVRIASNGGTYLSPHVTGGV